jgi:hypothetical protein
LSSVEKLERAYDACELTELLERQHRQPWHDIVTLNEVWLYFSTDKDIVWLPSGMGPGKRMPPNSSHENDGDDQMESGKIAPDCDTAEESRMQRGLLFLRNTDSLRPMVSM